MAFGCKNNMPNGVQKSYEAGVRQARVDDKHHELVYFVNGYGAFLKVKELTPVFAKYGYSVVVGYTDVPMDVDRMSYVDGYNSVSKSIIEEKIGITLE